VFQMERLVVENLRTYYYTPKGVVRAVDDVSFKLEEGESMGLAGESGCGKSTLCFSLLRLVPPPGKIVEGRIIFNGENITTLPEEKFRDEIRWRKISMIFQGALSILNPMYKVGEQLAEPLVYRQSMSKENAAARVKEILESVGLPCDAVGRYPHELSGGMKQRAVIGMAMIMDPSFVIADEPTTALDVVIQAQIFNLLKSLQQKAKISIMLVTHDLAAISELADRVGIMYAGKLVEFGFLSQVYEDPRHPYTQKLLKATPSLRTKVDKLDFIPGTPPDLIKTPKGCRFHPRCPLAKAACSEREPAEVEVERGHRVACWLHVRR